MLVLTRKSGEEIVIGDHIRITVLAVCGNRVRLGITAPPEIGIHRAELRSRNAPADDAPASDGSHDGSHDGPKVRGDYNPVS